MFFPYLFSHHIFYTVISIVVPHPIFQHWIIFEFLCHFFIQIMQWVLTRPKNFIHLLCLPHSVDFYFVIYPFVIPKRSYALHFMYYPEVVRQSVFYVLCLHFFNSLSDTHIIDTIPFALFPCDLISTLRLLQYLLLFQYLSPSILKQLIELLTTLLVPVPLYYDWYLIILFESPDVSDHFSHLLMYLSQYCLYIQSSYH